MLSGQAHQPKHKMKALPTDLWRLVMYRVQITHLGNFASVCRQWSSLALDENFWRSKLEEHFPMAESNVEQPGCFFSRIWSGFEIFPVEVLNLASLEGMFASAVLRCVSNNKITRIRAVSITIKL